MFVPNLTAKVAVLPASDLRRAQRAHDAAAREHMREATAHLRAACRLASELARRDRKPSRERAR